MVASHARPPRLTARRILATALPLVAAALAATVTTSRAAPPLHLTEDFTTTTHRDATATDAVWDTTAARVDLPPFEVTALSQTLPWAGHAVDAFVDGSYVHLAAHTNGVYRIDVSDPGAPVIRGHFDTAGITRGVVGYGGRVTFTADDVEGVYAFEWTSSGTVTGWTQYDTPGHAYGLALHGTSLFVADDDGGVLRLDVSNPLAPRLLASASGPRARRVCVAGNRLYVASTDQNLWIYDVSDTSAMLPIAMTNVGVQLRDVVVQGRYAFLAAYTSGLLVYDVSDPTMPVPVGSLASLDLTIDVDVDGTMLLMTDYRQGYRVIDVSDPTAPLERARSAAGGYAYTASWWGDKAVSTNWSSGLHVDHARAAFVGGESTLGAPTRAEAAVVVGNVAFVTGDKTMFAYDLSSPLGSPSSQVVAGLGWGEYFGRAMVASGNDLIVGVGGATSRAILRYDASDPYAPVRHATTSGLSAGGDSVEAMALHGSLLAVSSYRGSVSWGPHDRVGLVDVSTPDAPVERAAWKPSTGSPWGVPTSFAFDADRLWIGVDEGPGALVWILDVANPAAPVARGWFAPAGNTVTDLAVVDDHLFVAAGRGGLRVYDVSDPNAPVETFAEAPAWESTRGLAVSGDRLFVALDGQDADADGTVWAYDILRPGSPARLVTGALAIAQRPRILPAGPKVFAVGHRPYGGGNAGSAAAIPVHHTRRDAPARAQSLPLTSGSGTIAAVRFEWTGGGSVAPQASTDGGTTWVDGPFGSWIFPTGDARLTWRLDLLPLVYTDSYVSSLTIDALWAEPDISSLSDRGHDNGRQVDIQWTGSGYDRGGSPEPIAYYLVEAQPTWNGAPWAVVDSVPAGWLLEPLYVDLVPTTADSNVTGTHWHRFRVSAFTADGTGRWTSAVDSAYSVDHQPPADPYDVSVQYNAPGGNVVSWSIPDAADNAYTIVYRDTMPVIDPATAMLVTSVGGISTSYAWTDPDHSGPGVWYGLVAVDLNGNTGSLVTPGTVTAVDDTPARPRAWALAPPAPNPFNPVVRVPYAVPHDGDRVRIAVYDVTGRRVRVLVDGPARAGHHEATWTGRDAHGLPVASGVYFCRLSAPGFTAVRKMVLAK